MDYSCREKAAACYCRLTRKALAGGILALHLSVGQALYFLYMLVYGACSPKFRDVCSILSVVAYTHEWQDTGSRTLAQVPWKPAQQVFANRPPPTSRGDRAKASVLIWLYIAAAAGLCHWTVVFVEELPFSMLPFHHPQQRIAPFRQGRELT